MRVDLEERQELYRGCVAVAKVERVGFRNRGDRMLAKVATSAG